MVWRAGRAPPVTVGPAVSRKTESSASCGLSSPYVPKVPMVPTRDPTTVLQYTDFVISMLILTLHALGGAPFFKHLIKMDYNLMFQMGFFI